MELAGQIFSIIAMGVYILSFQAKKQKSIITFQMIANSLFAISFFMLDAKMGMILNIIIRRKSSSLYVQKAAQDRPRYLARWFYRGVYRNVYFYNGDVYQRVLAHRLTAGAWISFIAFVYPVYHNSMERVQPAYHNRTS